MYHLESLLCPSDLQSLHSKNDPLHLPSLFREKAIDYHTFSTGKYRRKDVIHRDFELDDNFPHPRVGNEADTYPQRQLLCYNDGIIAWSNSYSFESCKTYVMNLQTPHAPTPFLTIFKVPGFRLYSLSKKMLCAITFLGYVYQLNYQRSFPLRLIYQC
jgi:hypothetical protein